MSSEIGATLDVHRPKLNNKKSFTEMLFPFHHHSSSSQLPPPSKPKLQNSQSCGAKRTWKRPKIKIKNNSHTSKIGTFIHETLDIFSPHPQKSNLSDTDVVHLTISNEFKLKQTQKSRWKPSLDTICNDATLLSTLVAFMTRSYNEESILFLQSIRLLTVKCNASKPDEIEIDHHIYSIFTRYIAPDAKHQINLSSDCFANTTKMCQPPLLSSYSLDQKRSIFDAAVYEVNRLMADSVLDLFYDSIEFQSIAQLKDTSARPPIVLNMSFSAMSMNASATIETDDACTDEKGTDEEESMDDMVYVDDEYFDTLDMDTGSFSHSASSEGHD